MSIRQQHANAYAAVAQLDGAVNEVEQQRLERQGEVYRRLASWTLDALGLAPGQRVLEVGCGSGPLLLAAAARAKVAHLPWVEVIEADGLAYQPATSSACRPWWQLSVHGPAWQEIVRRGAAAGVI